MCACTAQTQDVTEDESRPAFSRSGDKVLDIEQVVPSNESCFLTTGLFRNTWHTGAADTICLVLLWIWTLQTITSAGLLDPSGVQMKEAQKMTSPSWKSSFSSQSPGRGVTARGRFRRWFSLKHNAISLGSAKSLTTWRQVWRACASTVNVSKSCTVEGNEGNVVLGLWNLATSNDAISENRS